MTPHSPALPHPAAASAIVAPLHPLQARWRLLPRADRRLVAGGAVAALALLVALVLTCQASVLKGERLRAEQRLLAGQAASPSL